MFHIAVVAEIICLSFAFSIHPASTTTIQNKNAGGAAPMEVSRRVVVDQTLATLGMVTAGGTLPAFVTLTTSPSPANGSGGATAGRYT
jgi:hypothetical protein